MQRYDCALDIGAEHCRHDFPAGEVADRCAIHHGPPVPEDGDIMGKRLDFIEFVADEKDGTATGTQIANDTKQPFGFLRGERSRRLIENEDATALADTTGDLEQLALTQCQRENGRAEIDRESHLIEPLT